ncbi:hypothetical protein B0H14DRAFT_2564258 [Mycena olivaceomarginata]|nr:hypothetical protein B0H14DRAFT_2564258 [Mycena olivaceomarginata]
MGDGRAWAMCRVKHRWVGWRGCMQLGAVSQRRRRRGRGERMHGVYELVCRWFGARVRAGKVSSAWMSYSIAHTIAPVQQASGAVGLGACLLNYVSKMKEKVEVRTHLPARPYTLRTCNGATKENEEIQNQDDAKIASQQDCTRERGYQ